MCIVIDTSSSKKAKLQSIAINAIDLKDNLWAPRIRMLREVTLPSQYEILEETGRIDNFRRASGKIKGEFKGRYYNDSDVYKWVEGTALALGYEHNSKLESLMEKVIVEITAAQESDGYLNTYFTFEKKKDRWSNLRDIHELYCAGHLIQAAIAHYRVTQRRTLLNTAIRLADHICNVFGPGKRVGVPGHPEIEMALVELYRVTNDRKYLELAKFFIDQRGKGLIGGEPYHVDHRPFRDLEEITGHAVRALYLNCGATDLYMETGEEALLSALERMWRSMVEKKMYVTGGVGARYEGEAFGDAYELPNLRAYAETCAAIANVMWNWRMLLTTGEERFTEVMELALYNGALAGISLDGKEYFYVNPLSSRGNHRRQTWFECACCPTNIVRLIGAIPNYIYTTSSEGIWLHLYVNNLAKIELGGEEIEITEHTDYPWDGEVEVSLHLKTKREFSLFLRIPGWCEGAKAFVNGRAIGSDIEPGTYFRVRRIWKKGDKVRLSMPMPIQMLISHPWVESNVGKVALKRGPIIYCLEQVDNPKHDVWNIGIAIESKLFANWRPDLLGGVVTIEGEGYVLDVSTWQGKLYVPFQRALPERKPVWFVAIPYYVWANRDAGPMTVWIHKEV